MRDVPRIAFGIGDLFTATLVLVSVFVGLPARWWVVDVSAALVAVLLLAAGVGLLFEKAWAKDVARFASFAVLIVAALAIGAVSTGIAYLRAIQGPLGKGGTLIFSLVLALVIPYLVILPALQLLWIGGAKKRST